MAERDTHTEILQHIALRNIHFKKIYIHHIVDIRMLYKFDTRHFLLPTTRRAKDKNLTTMKAFAVVLAMAAIVAAQEMQATVKMMPNNATSDIAGILKVVQTGPNAEVVITGTLSGLKPGKHGFHVHEKGDLSDGCTSTGSHFNPLNKRHGAPEDAERHVGDLGNVAANSEGIVNIQISDKMLSLTGSNSILGRAFVIHEGVDDLGKTTHKLSSTTGNAGSRLACGVVGIVLPVGSWTSSSIRVKIEGQLILLMAIVSTLAHQSRCI